MAESYSDGDRLRVPTWLMSVICGGMLVVGGTGIKTWADTNSNGNALTNHEGRITSVEGKIGAMQSDIAVIKNQQADQKDRDKVSADKLDRILSLELARSRAK